MNAPWRPTPGEATLVFAQGGGRTFLSAQCVPYPFHITKPHRLDMARPDIATVYLQSASGGLFRGDALSLTLAARPGAVAHVTSQAATVAHRASERPIALATRLDVHAGAALALTTDPFILFPGAAFTTTADVLLHPGAVALIAEGFALHDPLGTGRAFATLTTATRVQDTQGRVLVDERARFGGADFLATFGPLGGYRALGSALVLGGEIDPGEVERRLDSLGVLTGASRLPNGAGWSVRLLAPDGGRLAGGLDAVFTLGFEALTGCRPARRRK